MYSGGPRGRNDDLALNQGWRAGEERAPQKEQPGARCTVSSRNWGQGSGTGMALKQKQPGVAVSWVRATSWGE